MAGYIYIVKIIRMNNVYKIGETWDLESRLTKHSLGHPYGVEVVNTHECKHNRRETEKYLHSLMGEHRIPAKIVPRRKKDGEFFEIGRRTMAKLEQAFEKAKEFDEQLDPSLHCKYDYDDDDDEEIEEEYEDHDDDNDSDFVPDSESESDDDEDDDMDED
jgi:hypothetical protein